MSEDNTSSNTNTNPKEKETNMNNTEVNEGHPNNTAGYVYQQKNEKMREIHEIYIVDSRRVLLENLFPTPTGIVGAVEMDTIQEGFANNAYHNLTYRFPKIIDWEIKNLQYAGKLREILMNRKYGENGHVTKVTRLLKKILTQSGVDLSAGSDDNKFYEKWLVAYTSLFTCEELNYQVRWDVEAFDLLGNLKDVDGPNSPRSSCYNNHSEYFPDAPVALAAGFGQDVPTFVVLIRNQDDTDYAARCWGIANDSGIYILSNGYYANKGVTRDISTFHRVTEIASGVPTTFRRCPSFSDYYTLPIYTNSDTILCWRTSGDKPVDGYESKNFSFRLDECLECGDNHNHINHNFKHAFCGKCAKDSDADDGLRCHDCDEVISEDNRMYCDTCGNYYCDDCWSNDHHYCEHCEEDVCGVNDTDTFIEVYIEYRWSGRTNTQYWCEHCVNSGATQCGHCETYREDSMSTCPNNCQQCGNCESDFGEDDAFCPSCGHAQCDQCGDWTQVRDSDGNEYCEDCHTQCTECEEYFLHRDIGKDGLCDDCHNSKEEEEEEKEEGGSESSEEEEGS